MSKQHIQSLESRQMFAASVAGDTLTVVGSTGADTIRIDQNTSGALVVTQKLGANAQTVSTFTNSGVTKIVVNALGGNDVVTINTNVTRNSTVRGGDGDDSLTGSNRIDHLYGDAGQDVLQGRGGNDRLYAGTGSGLDTLAGGDGNDHLVSVGGGWDIANGNAGTDTFWIDKQAVGGPGGVDGNDATASERANQIQSFKVLKAIRNGVTLTSSPGLDPTGGNFVDPDPVVAGFGVTTYRNFSNKPLFGSSIGINDINQGNVGDCYFQATLAGFAQRSPNLVQRTITDLGDGTYAVRFGSEFIRVDGDLPSNAAGQLVYGGLGDNGSVWAAIMEKAWAFKRTGTGSYNSIVRGNPAEVLFHMGMNPFDATFVGQDKTGMMNRLKADMQAGKACLALSPSTGTPGGFGIRGNHQYLVQSITLNASGQVSSIRVFNPHGVDNRPSGESPDSNPSDGLITLTPDAFMLVFSFYNAASV